MKENLGIKIMIFIILIMNVFTFFKLSEVYDFYDASYPKITGDCSRATKNELRKFATQFRKFGSLPRNKEDVQDYFKGINILDKAKRFYYDYPVNDEVKLTASFDYIEYNDKFSFLITNDMPFAHGREYLIYSEYFSLYILKEKFSEDEMFKIFDKIYEIHDFSNESEKINYEKSPKWNEFLANFPKAKNFIQVREYQSIQGDQRYFPIIIQNSEKDFFFIETVESEAEKLSMRSFDAVDFANENGNLISLKRCHCIFDPIGFRA